MRVHQLMTTDVVAVGTDTPLKEVARRLAERGISGMPVIAEDRAVLGVISESDILASSVREPSASVSVLDQLHHRVGEETDTRTAGDLMTAPAVTIDAGWQAFAAAELMLEHRVNRLPVVERGRLVGVVSRADIVRAFARSDEQIAGEVRDLVALQQELWRDERPIAVTVTEGEVTLAGAVATSDEAAVIAKMVRTVPGVVNARSELMWR